MTLKRRSFLLGAGAAVSLPALWQQSHSRSPARAVPAGGLSDRSTTRDPLAVQRGTLVVSGLDVSVLNDEYLQMLRRGGVNCWHKSASGINDISDLYNFVDSRSDVTIARTVREIREAHAADKISVVFGWQAADTLGPRLLDNMGPPRTSLRAYYELGLRIIGIAYNLTNYFGAGNMEGSVPLSRAGRRLVEEVHKLRMLLDVGGHTGEQTSLDAIAMARDQPVICSHTNIATIADNPRNISDRLIDAIARTGGVIGITAVNDFHVRTRHQMDVAHSPRVGVAALVDQLEYLKKRVGVDHIGLGPDFVHDRNIDYDQANQSLAINREIISDGPWLYVEGFEDTAKLPNVTAEMIRRGWSTADIHKTLGENWLRVYQQVWGA